MKKFFNYMLGVLTSPTRTFKEIKEDRNINKYLLYSIVLYASFSIVGLISFYISLHVTKQYQQQYPSTPINLEKLVKSYTPYFLILYAFGWLLIGTLIHFFTRIFSRTGNLKTYLTMYGIYLCFSTIFSLVFVFLFSLFDKSSNVMQVLYLLFLVYQTYINVLAISINYELSILKSFAVTILSSITLFILILSIVWTFVYFVIFPKLKETKVENNNQSGFGQIINTNLPKPN